MLAGPPYPPSNSNQMIIVTKNVIAFLGPALAWLGGQGTRAIAALVFIGIAVPPLGELLKPFVTEAVFLVLCTSFLRVNLGSLRDYLRRPGSCSGRERMDHGGRALDRGRGYGVFRRTAIGSREENASIRTAEPGH